MNWKIALKLTWEVLKEWEIVKDALFQKFFAYTLPYSIPISNDLSGISIIITGCTNGIGLQTARQLAMAGAHVIMACRNVKAANDIARKWRDEASNGRILNVEVMELDLASLSSVRKFGAEWERRGEQLHMLINNAGILLSGEPQRFSADGIEQHMLVNHIAPALLTLLLLPSLLRPSSSRIINVNSVGHHCGMVQTQYWNSRMKEENYSLIKAYGSSKLSHLMFLKILATKLLDQRKASVQCIAVNPGAVHTNLESDDGGGNLRLEMTEETTAGHHKPFCMFDAVEGSRSVIFCATNDATRENLVKGFAYYSSNCKPRKISQQAADMDKCFEVWQKTLDILELNTEYLPHILDQNR